MPLQQSSTDYSHVQTFVDNLLNIVLFYFQLICNYSNSQPTIATHHPFYPLDTDYSLTFLTLLPPCDALRTSCSTQKHACMTWYYPHFTRLWRSFLQQGQKFQVYSLFGVHGSFYSAHSWTRLKWGFQVIVIEFSLSGPKISGLFVVRCSWFVPQCS